MNKTDKYIGLEVHQDAIRVAVAESGRKREIQIHGRTSSDLRASLLSGLPRIAPVHPRYSFDTNSRTELLISRHFPGLFNLRLESAAAIQNVLRWAGSS